MVFGPGTAACIINRVEASATRHIFEAGANAGGRVGLAVSSADVLRLYMGGSTRDGTTALTPGWYLVAFTKASGTVIPRAHIYRYDTGTWVHEAAGSAIANQTLGTTEAQIGASLADGQLWNGDVELAGFWDVELTDAQIEMLPFGLTPWFQENPKALWLLDQADVAQTVMDLTGGGANQTAIVGTTVATASTPVWNRFDDAILVTRPPAAGGPVVTFDATIAGAAAVTDDLALSQALAAVVAGSGTVAAEFVRQIALDALIAGTAQVVTGLAAQTVFNAAVAGQGTVVAHLDLPTGAVAVIASPDPVPVITIAVL